MKKIAIMLLIVLTIFTLTACDQTENDLMDDTPEN